MKSVLRIVSILIISSSIFAQNLSIERPLLGFTAESSARQRELESKFDSVLSAENLRTWMKRLSARPHHVGSPYDKENAEFMAAQFRSWGYDTAIEQFQVLFPTPK